MGPRARDDAVVAMARACTDASPADVLDLLEVMRELVGASAIRCFVADYSLRRLQQIDGDGPVGAPRPTASTLLGRVFTSGETRVTPGDPTVVMVPLVEGTCPLGVVELDYAAWPGDVPPQVQPIVALFVMAWIVKGRYTDAVDRARRSEPLSAAAEILWDLLPPLACATDAVAVGGILEPAYQIGGDAFDYAFDRTRVDFVMVDAVGHGMPAVLLSAAAINSLRNSRRASRAVAEAYELADRTVADQFGDSNYATALLATLDLTSGILTWVNAGHVLPMLVRNGTYAGMLRCAPSRPLGLGGPVAEVATHQLQRGDRVLFYTDGITEARTADGSFYGEDRLAERLVRVSLENLAVQETVRHLAEGVLDFVDTDLRDDATMLLVEYRPPQT